ncbi:MAG: MFS transporter [Myxococcales bacterium]|nr:MFS transporter [Myxococcales bacterium]
MNTHNARLRSIVAGSAGNLIEWYDWYAYSAFSLYFAPVFFPAGDRTAELLRAAAVFAVGFVVRPIGAWIMGNYADRRGRKSGLALSVAAMCAGSLAIALAPSHARAGALSPAILVGARLLQGLSVGGEYGASATYLSEIAVSRHRGFWSSFQYVTLVAGQLLALGVLAALQRALPRAALQAWGWRVPFAIGAALGVVVFFLRRDLVETAPPDAARRRGGALALVREHPREAALVVGLTAGGTVAFYTYTTYLQKFLVVTSGFAAETATTITALALGVFMLLQPVVGAISDRVGRRPVMIAFGVLGATTTYPLLSALAQTRDPRAAFALALVALAIVSGYTAINAVVKAELFPAHVRALGVALPYAIANTLFGGTAEYVALWLKSAGHERVFFAYVSALIAGSLVVYARMRETRAESRIEPSDP